MVALPSAPPIDSRRFEEITRDWRDRAELIHEQRCGSFERRFRVFRWTVTSGLGHRVIRAPHGTFAADGLAAALALSLT